MKIVKVTNGNANGTVRIFFKGQIHQYMPVCLIFIPAGIPGWLSSTWVIQYHSDICNKSSHHGKAKGAYLNMAKDKLIRHLDIVEKMNSHKSTHNINS